MTRRKWFWFLLFLGLAYRLLFVFKSNLPPVIFDATAYDELANTLLSKGRFEIAGKPFAFYTPGYPFFLTAVYWLFGRSNYQAVYIIQALLSTLNLWLAFRLIKSWWGEKAGLLAMGLMAVYSPFVYANALVLTEVWYTTWLLIWLNHLSHILFSKSAWQAWWFNGMIWGVVLSIRPATGLFIPGLILLAGLSGLLPKWVTWPLPKLSQLLMMLLGAVIILSPWTFRNYYIFDKLIPFSAESGNVFLLGTYVGYRHEPDYPNWPRGQDEVETDSLKIKYGIQRIKDNLRQEPVTYSWWYVSKFKFFWFWPYSESKKFLPGYEQQQAIHKLLVFVSFVGMYWLIKKKNRIAWLMTYLLAYLTLIHMAFMTLDRLAFPTMYIVLGFSALGILRIYELAESPLKKIYWKKQLSLGGLLTSLILLIVLVGLSNSSFNHYSLLRWFNPTLATLGIILRKVGLIVVSSLLAYSLLGKKITKTWPLVVLLAGAILLMTKFSVLADPRVLRSSPTFKVKLEAGQIYSKYIDLPLHLGGRDNWSVKVKFGRDFRDEVGGKLIVLAEGKKIGEIQSDSIQEFDWREFPLRKISKDRVKIEVSSEKTEGEIYLWGLSWKNYGLSLTPTGEVLPGSYEIGLSSRVGSFDQIPIWYGSSSYGVRQKLLQEK